MKLKDNVGEDDVDEALRIFENSTMNAISNGGELGLDNSYDFGPLVLKIEESI